LVGLRPNATSDAWTRASISAYYWTGAVSLFAGTLAALAVYLLTYQGYENKYQKYDRTVAIVAGIAAAAVALFPTTPPSGLEPHLSWWHAWIGYTHTGAAITLFSMFAIFSLWLFRKTARGEEPTPDKKRRNAFYLFCGIGIVASMAWAVVLRLRNDNASVFWPESTALWFFAWSWLVKGDALASIGLAARAAKKSIARH
jgi:hypothetical protein